MRILLVNEEEPTNTALALILSNDGHQVHVDTSGRAALESFRIDPFPLAIIDMHLADMSGIELLKKIKKLDDDTQVIMMTSFALMQTALEALRNGAYDYIIKNLEELSTITVVVGRAEERLKFITENRALMASLQAYHEELKLDNRTLDAQAMLDIESGLRDRRFFLEIAEAELRRSMRHGRSCSIVMLSLPAQPAGERVGALVVSARAVAVALRSRLRRTDVIARLDERCFAALLPETSRAGAEVVRKNLLAALTELVGDDDSMVAAGTAVYPADGSEVEELLRRAGEALPQGTVS